MNETICLLDCAITIHNINTGLWTALRENSHARFFNIDWNIPLFAAITEYNINQFL